MCLQDYHFDDLPDELLAKVGEGLNGLDLLHAFMASKRWYAGLRRGLQTAKLCIPHRKHGTWLKELHCVMSLPLRTLTFYGLVLQHHGLFRGAHKSIKALPDIGKFLMMAVDSLPCLTALNLSHVQLDSNHLVGLSRLSNLRELSLGHCVLIDKQETQSIPLHYCRSLRLLTIRNLEWFQTFVPEQYCPQATFPLPLEITYPDSLLELKVTECEMHRDFASSLSLSLQQKLESVQFRLPLDLSAISNWSNEDTLWSAKLITKHLGGFRHVRELSILLDFSMTRREEQRMVQHLDRDQLCSFPNLSSLTIKWSNSLLQFTSRRLSLTDLILDLVGNLIGRCEGLKNIDITLPLVGKSESIIREIAGRSGLFSLKIDTKEVRNAPEVDYSTLFSYFHHQASLHTLKINLGLSAPRALFDPPSAGLDIFKVIFCMKGLHTLVLRNWPLGSVTKECSLPCGIRELCVEGSSNLITTNIASLSHLTCLSMTGDCITLKEIMILGSLPNLTSLSLLDIEYGGGYLAEYDEHLPRPFRVLNRLAVESKCSGFVNKVLESMPPTLCHLKVSGPSQICSTLQSAICLMKGLKSIDLSRNSWLDNCFFRGFPHLPQLSTLDISECPGVTGACLGSVQGIWSLRKVVMTGILDEIHDMQDWWDLEEDFPRCDIQCGNPALKSKCWWW